MGVVITDIVKTIDATVDGAREFIWDDVPLVVTLEIEEATLIIRVGLRLVEMTVLANVFLQVAMTVDTVVALQF